jgi:hypothetical protein
MKTKTALVFLLAAALALPAAFAGVVFEIETKHHESGLKATAYTYAEGRNLKMDILAGEGGSGKGSVIYLGDRREVVVVDDDDKTYTVVDEESMQQIASQVSGVMDQMQEALKNVPKEQRTAVEEMMKQRMPSQMPERSKSVLRKTSDRTDKHGYPCVRYEILHDGHKIRELWVTDWSNVEGGREAVDAFEGLAGFFTELLDSIPDFGDGGPGVDQAFEHLKEIGGFPVVSLGFAEDGSLEDESSLRSSRRQTLDPATFEPPAGYKRRSMLGQ